MYEVKIIKAGYATWMGPTQQRADGTITLVKGAKNIIVDTGCPWDKEIIMNFLAGEKLGVNDINYVICTHGHSDHIGNNNLFQDAIFIVSYDVSKRDVYTFHNFVLQPYIIDDDVRVIATPGHTSQDISVIVKTSIGVVAIVGDLFECEDDLKTNSLWQSFSENQDIQLQNRKKILEVADYIVPGHGNMFKVNEVLKGIKIPKSPEKIKEVIKVNIPYYNNEGKPFDTEKINFIESFFRIICGGFSIDEGRGEWINNNEGKLHKAHKEGHYSIEVPEGKNARDICEIIKNLIISYFDQKEAYVRLLEIKEP
jgi:glyoxylase-like metal-dependent hydrolase (beta-lactamase superfamily II)